MTRGRLLGYRTTRRAPCSSGCIGAWTPCTAAKRAWRSRSCQPPPGLGLAAASRPRRRQPHQQGNLLWGRTAELSGNRGSNSHCAARANGRLVVALPDHALSADGGLSVSTDASGARPASISACAPGPSHQLRPSPPCSSGLTRTSSSPAAERGARQLLHCALAVVCASRMPAAGSWRPHG
jgi:hypothetical protein